MFMYLLVTAAILIIIHIVFNYHETARLIRKIPGPKENFIVGNALQLFRSPAEAFKFARDSANKFENLFRLWAFPYGIVNIYNPEDIEKIVSNSKFNEKSIVYKFLKPWLQDGLLLSKDAKWQHRRKILTPTFHFNVLRQFFVTFEENSQRLVDSLRKTRGESTNIVSALSEFTLYSVCETAMGTRLHEQSVETTKAYKTSIYELGKLIILRFVTVYLYSDFVFSLLPVAKRQQKYLDILHNFTKKVIDEKKQYAETYGYSDTNIGIDDDTSVSTKKRVAMLDLLISAERDGLIDKVGIQEEVDTFMFEGHDTTAGGLTFCTMLLANHKHVQDKILEELRGIFGEDLSRPASYEDLAKMKYLECVIKESLRLYPPVPFISRNATETLQLSGYTVPPGTVLHIHIYDLHRRENLFKNPLIFDPDRFLPENSIGRHTYSYIPFSAGPRNCIGQKFALMEMKLCIAALLRNFELQPVTRECDLDFVADVVLRTASPIYVKFVPRK